MSKTYESRRSVWIDISDEAPTPLSPEEVEAFENLDLVYRSLCAMLYNYVPLSGHPGGSVSSGRFVQAAIFDAMDYDMADPNGLNADLLSYAAGHKALGLYAISAIRNEITRIAAPELLPEGENLQMRLEDLLGFRKNPRFPGPLFNQFKAKALDGHPTPVTPFVRLSTGASGVGFASSIGLGYAAMDSFPANPPRVHIVEGEGGMTPGRVAEAMASAATSSLRNVIVHLDWNQASIDSNHVTREGSVPGDYVQWNPCDLFAVNDWNVIFVPDGTDFQQIVGAQRRALALDNGQPTAIVYRTTKGWRYGIEGRASHGAGHKLCSPGFYEALRPLVETFGVEVPTCDAQNPFCAFGTKAEAIEGCFWGAMQAIRKVLEENPALTQRFSDRLVAARNRVLAKPATPAAPGRLDALFAAAQQVETPESLHLVPGSSVTLRGQLGKVLHHLNTASGGALLASSADLMGSTSLDEAIKGFPTGFFNAGSNPGSRLISTGGICEDGMAGILSGIAGFGQHLGVGSSYAAFIAPLGHIAARLHAIGSHARQSTNPGPNVPFMLIMGHAGLKTGEDGPTHADPQPLQILQENFPRGMAVTLTPWDPQEMWPLLSAALRARPAFIAPFVTRPAEKVLDREALGLAPASHAAQGVYLLRKAAGECDGTLVLQDSGVAYAFVEQTLPRLTALGIDLDVYYVASAELFDLLPEAERQRIFPEAKSMEAMGITGFTLSTMYRWVRSDLGRAMTLHPFRGEQFLGSGPGDMVIHEAGLDGDAQVAAIQKYVEALAKTRQGDTASMVN